MIRHHPFSAAIALMAAIVTAHSGPAASERIVALTFDDLPYAGRLQGSEDAGRATDGILSALKRHGAPASGFVTSRNIFREGQVDHRMDLLRRWIREGHPLENHTWSHPDFQRTPLERYQDDAIKGDTIPRLLMAEAGLEPRYFRHPMNHTGKSVEEKAAFEDFMKERGYAIIPFTVEHADYLYNALYEEALRRGDEEEARRLGDAYMAHLAQALDFAEGLSRETFGREIPQIFLAHANTINGRYMEAMLHLFEERGYRFVTVDDALSDPALRTRDDYVGPSGISWIHRWRRTLGKEDRLRDEPDPPKWALQAWRELQATNRARRSDS